MLEKLRNKRIKRLVKKTHLWASTQIEFLRKSIEQNCGSSQALRIWLDELDGKEMILWTKEKL